MSDVTALTGSNIIWVSAFRINWVALSKLYGDRFGHIPGAPAYLKHQLDEAGALAAAAAGGETKKPINRIIPARIAQCRYNHALSRHEYGIRTITAGESLLQSLMRPPQKPAADAASRA